MKRNISQNILISPQVDQALKSGLPVVAFESTVVTHGLPFPTNLELAKEMEEIARNAKVTPATIALMRGKVLIGLQDSEMSDLAKSINNHKISTKDIAFALHKNWNGGTTVAATLFFAHLAGISVFATGGIGGVHRNSNFDISNDLYELSKRRVVVICSGVKSILDISSTLEYLETMGVPLFGYQTNRFPEFYSKGNGEHVVEQIDTTNAIAQIYNQQCELGLPEALLVANPVPDEYAIEKETMEANIEAALLAASISGIHGPETTPFILSKVAELSGGRALQANLALLRNNAQLACEVAIEISQLKSRRKLII